jgi:hypothetical protein
MVGTGTWILRLALRETGLLLYRIMQESETIIKTIDLDDGTTEKPRDHAKIGGEKMRYREWEILDLDTER